jgi:hypothetical protein
MAARRDTNKSGDAMFRWRWRSLSSIGHLPHRREARRRRSAACAGAAARKNSASRPAIGGCDAIRPAEQAGDARRARLHRPAGGRHLRHLARRPVRPPRHCGRGHRRTVLRCTCDDHHRIVEKPPVCEPAHTPASSHHLVESETEAKWRSRLFSAVAS